MFDKIYNTLCSIRYWVNQIVAAFCMFALTAMTVLITYQVIVRYFFNSPSAVSEVLAKYFFVWLILYAGAYVFGTREHMAIGFIRDKFPRKVNLVLQMITELSVAGFALYIMAFGGYKISLRQMMQSDSALQIPMGVIYSAIPISGALIVFYCVINELDLIKQFNTIAAIKEERDNG